MKVLGVDTTRKSAVVFVVDTDDLEKSKFEFISENIKHSDGLFLYIEKILFDVGCNLDDIDAFAGVVGPGSFTGIRVGMSTIKGLNKVKEKSIISIKSFDLFSNIKNGVILLNSTSSSCYYAIIEKSKVVSGGVVDKKSIKEISDDKKIYILKEEQNLINAEYDNIIDTETLKRSYIDTILENMNTMQYGDFQPYYLQLSQAERNASNV